MLYRFRLLDYEDGRPKVKLAALLLFGKDPLRWHPRCGIDFVKYEGTESKVVRELNIIKRARIELPLIRLIDEAYENISPHIKERQYRHDLFFVEKFEYLSFAWQEAIVNAIAHGDYSIQGLSIEAWMFDDRIEVRSPGLLKNGGLAWKLYQSFSLFKSLKTLLQPWQALWAFDLPSAPSPLLL